MTTLVAYPGCIAADRRVAGGLQVCKVRAVTKPDLGDVLVGTAGQASSIRAVGKWAEDEAQGLDDLAELMEKHDSEALVVTREAVYYVDSAGAVLQSPHKGYFAGSGGTLAFGYFCGAAEACPSRLEEAVEFAAGLDPYTGDGVDVLELTPAVEPVEFEEADDDGDREDEPEE